MKGNIGTILEPFSNRTSKAGKPYSAMKAEIVLENGETARCLIFEDLPEGASVDLEQKDGYWNVISKKQAAANAQHDELVKRLDRIERILGRIYVQVGGEVTPSPKPAVEAPKTLTERYHEARAKAAEPEPVYPVNEDEEINLDDIPF